MGTTWKEEITPSEFSERMLAVMRRGTQWKEGARISEYLKPRRASSGSVSSTHVCTLRARKPGSLRWLWTGSWGAGMWLTMFSSAYKSLSGENWWRIAVCSDTPRQDMQENVPRTPNSSPRCLWLCGLNGSTCVVSSEGAPSPRICERQFTRVSLGEFTTTSPPPWQGEATGRGGFSEFLRLPPQHCAMQ